MPVTMPADGASPSYTSQAASGESSGKAEAGARAVGAGPDPAPVVAHDHAQRVVVLLGLELQHARPVLVGVHDDVGAGLGHGQLDGGGLVDAHPLARAELADPLADGG